MYSDEENDEDSDSVSETESIELDELKEIAAGMNLEETGHIARLEDLSTEVDVEEWKSGFKGLDTLELLGEDGGTSTVPPTPVHSPFSNNEGEAVLKPFGPDKPKGFITHGIGKDLEVLKRSLKVPPLHESPSSDNDVSLFQLRMKKSKATEAGKIELSPLSAEMEKCLDEEDSEGDEKAAADTKPPPSTEKERGSGLTRVDATDNLLALTRRQVSDSEEISLSGKDEKRAEAHEEARYRCTFKAFTASVPELTAHCDREEAWTGELAEERIRQRLRPFEQRLYMEGDYFTPDFPRFPINAAGRAIAVDEIELRERRRAEVEFVRQTAPAFAAHLDSRGWPGPFQEICDWIREEKEQGETKGPEFKRPAKRNRRWGPRK